MIYESYKPTNLREMQDFIHFVLTFRRIVPNSYHSRKATGDKKVASEASRKSNPYLSKAAYQETAKMIHPQIPQKACSTVDDILLSNEVSQEIKNYYNAEVQTRLPDNLGKLSDGIK